MTSLARFSRVYRRNVGVFFAENILLEFKLEADESIVTLWKVRDNQVEVMDYIALALARGNGESIKHGK